MLNKIIMLILLAILWGITILLFIARDYSDGIFAFIVSLFWTYMDATIR